jgi:hypothetical protein
VHSEGQSIVTSRSVPQHTAQINSPFAGQNRFAFRFPHIGQLNPPPQQKRNPQITQIAPIWKTNNFVSFRLGGSAIF